MKRIAILATSLAVLLLTASLTSCSVPRDSEARVLTDAALPTVSRTTVPAPDGPAEKRTVYFVRDDDRLEGIEVDVPAPAGPAQLLEALRKGPDQPLRRRLTTKIPGDVRFDAQIRKEAGPDGEVEVFISSTYLKDLTTAIQLRMFQQIVWTLSEVRAGPYPNVRFEVNLKKVNVPLQRPKGEGEAVARADFASDSVVTTTTTSTTTTTAPPSSVVPPTSAAAPSSLAPATR